jgi:pSer/pThr/pTyr-binding forkhead associated (FHA) protein
LIVRREDGTLVEKALHAGRVVIGRTPDNDLQIEERYVSRHHCQVITTADGSVIEDLNSTNGIYLKGKRMRRHHLNDGDVITIGRREIVYVDERAARARQASEPRPTAEDDGD